MKAMNNTKIIIRNVTIGDYDRILELWNSTEQSRRALNPVDDSREGIERYLRRNPATCFLACPEEDPRQVSGVILTGHDGRRAIIHHLCVRRRKRCALKGSRKSSDWSSRTTRRPTPSGRTRDIRCGPT